MKELYRKRQHLQQRKLMKYLRLVFNDHFTLVLFILFGGGMYFYSNGLKGVTPHQSWLLLFVSFLWLCLLQVGHLASLVQPADEHFLLPKEGAFLTYLKTAFYRSLTLPLLALLLGVGVAAPLLMILQKGATINLVSFVLLLWSLKATQLLFQVGNFYPTCSLAPMKKFFLLYSVLLVVGACYLPTIAVTLLSILVCIFVYRQLFFSPDLGSLAWGQMIAAEKKRMKRIYQFLALFTTVPEINSSVKRRRGLDFLLRKIPQRQQQTYFYLFARRFLRGNDYSSLWLSITSLGVVLILTLQNFYGVIGVGGVFLYLLGLQLLPLSQHFDYMTLTLLYPISLQQKRQNFLQLLGPVLLAMAFIFVFSGLWVLTWLQTGLFLGILGIEIFIFCYLYAPRRLSRLGRL